ncbi:30S ribosomal protein S16 [mine drainage metagenome]|uniref:30S ribosomal protein S16 n=1 Tax=mine drainage metagenome TaxID=410659 RepID=T0Y9R5_9ZZZZ
MGFYNPLSVAGAADSLRLDLARVTFWQERGAQVSDAVAKLVKRVGAQTVAA